MPLTLALLVVLSTPQVDRACRPLGKGDVARLLQTPWCGGQPGSGLKNGITWTWRFGADGTLDLELHSATDERSAFTWKVVGQKLEVKRADKRARASWCELVVDGRTMMAGPMIDGLFTNACPAPDAGR